MDEKKVTDKLLERIKYFINSVNNGEYELHRYEFTIKLHTKNNNILEISETSKPSW